MKKSLKIIVGVVGGIAILIVFALIAAVIMIDSIVKTGVEKGGKLSMGVDTSLKGAHISLFAASGSLSGLRVANPAGFETPHFLSLSDGAVAVAASTLNQQKIVIPKLELSGIDVNLEKKDGKANYDVILDNLKAFQDSLPKDQGGKSDAAAGKDQGKKFVINQIIIRDVTVHADTLGGIGGKLARVEVKIPEVTLKDIGSDTDGGVALSQVTGTIVTALFQAIAKHGAGVLPADAINGINQGVADVGKLGEAGVKAVGDLATGATQSLDEASKGVTEGIGGLFGDKKKK